jgi:hypothetical protein
MEKPISKPCRKHSAWVPPEWTPAVKTLLREAARQLTGHKRRAFLAQVEKHWKGALLKDAQNALDWAKTMTWKGVAPLVKLTRKVGSTSVLQRWGGVAG